MTGMRGCQNVRVILCQNNTKSLILQNFIPVHKYLRHITSLKTLALCASLPHAPLGLGSLFSISSGAKHTM